MITAYEKQAIVNRQVQMLVRQELDRQRTEREAATARRLAEQERKIRELEERLKAKSTRVDSLCAQLIDAMPETHPDPPPGSRLGDALWGLLGLILIGFDELCDRITERCSA